MSGGLSLSATIKVSALIALALFSGVGIVYAPTLAFTAVAIIFAVALWSMTRDGRQPYWSPNQDRKNKGRSRSALTTKLVSGFLLLWWLALIAPMFVYSQRDVTNAAEASVGGSQLNQVLLLAFGMVGALFLPRAMKRLDPAFRWVLILWTLHLCWTFISLFWSVYPALTLRNAVAFTVLSVGSFGLGAGFYGNLPNGRELFLRHLFVAGVLSALVVLIPLPVRWSEYDLLDPSQRLAIGGGFPMYVVRPVVCTLLALSAATVLRMRVWQRRDWLWLALLVAPLLLLKSRGPILYALLAFCLFYFLYKTRVQDRFMQAGLVLILGIGSYVYYFTGVYGVLVTYLTRGDVETTMTLTGRIPLWDFLIPQIQQHPWLGVGFAAYWNPEVLPTMELNVGFPAVSAHNGFLDMLLGTGIIGLVIMLAFYFCTIGTVVRRARRGDPLGWLVFLFAVFSILQNLTVSTFTEFLEIPLIAILALIGLMASRPAVRPPAPREVSSSPARRPSGRHVVSLR